MVRKTLLAAALAAAACIVPAAADQSADGVRVGPHSGLPVPRFVSLDSDEANGRRRPAATAPIDWIYVTPGLPLQVVAESGPWRRVKDPDGGQVWMHVSALNNAQSAYVMGGSHDEVVLRRAPRVDARAVAILDRGVVAEVTGCEDGWARLRVDGHDGWARAELLWGAVECP